MIRICVDLEFLVLQVPEEKNAMAPASAQVGSGVVSVSLLFFSSEVQGIFCPGMVPVCMDLTTTDRYGTIHTAVI